MERMGRDNFIIGPEDLILVTGAGGFIGSQLVNNLLTRGFRKLRCLFRSTRKAQQFERELAENGEGAHVEVMVGNLLSPDDCASAVRDVTVLYHLAAARGEKSFPDAFLNSVVTTRNLLDAAKTQACFRRFVNVSSFTVYTNSKKPRRRLLDESCPLESHPELRGDAYDFAKGKQDQIVMEYGKNFAVPYVIVRPGYVYGPGNLAIPGRVGIGTFGLFLHLGGSNTLPLTYVDNCADAIVLAGLRPGVEGEVFNVVDDDLPSSRHFLRLYKKTVKRFASVYVPHAISYLLCCLWEQYSIRSQKQLPLSFTRRKWHSYWKKTYYSNEKLKTRLGWVPKVRMARGLECYFAACRDEAQRA